MPTDTELDNLVINQLTQAQYNGATINNNELYFVTDGKISADDVDDSNATNKFVTASDKTNWNAKQDEIDSNHKLSADLVDDSNTTNKFVTSTDKTTWNGKQDELVSGTNIKTINNQSLLGSGNITISTGGTATDVQINGTSITSNNVADIITETAYNATTNKIATVADIPTDTSDLTNNAGYITGINSSDVTTALGYTPYDSSNPNGYTSNTGTVTQVNAGVGLNTTGDDCDIDGGSLTTTGTLYLTKSGVTAGTYQGITVDKYGRVTGASDQGYTTNVGTVTSVNNVSPVSGNVTLTASDVGAQETLVSGTNIKTINSTSILGSGDIATLQASDVVDNVTSTSTNKPLSANMGKELQDQIDNLKARGRFLALWNSATGLAETNPTTSPYTYSTGDYFIVGIIDSSADYPAYDTTATYNTNDKCSYNGDYYICNEDNVTGAWDSTKWTAHTITNYKPNGSSYTTGVASSTVETEAVAIDDVYYYDGTNWKLQVNTQKTVSFANIAGQPTDNLNLASALNAKANDSDVVHKTGNETIAGTKTFTNSITANRGDNQLVLQNTAYASIFGSYYFSVPGQYMQIYNKDGNGNNQIAIFIDYGARTILKKGSKIKNYSTNTEYEIEDVGNKVTSISSSSTDTQYPSAKLVYDQLATKQDALVSGTNIKTINSTSLLGSGDVTVASTDLNNLSNTGKIAIAHNAMPSGTYEEVTVGATGTQYQAPADGYFAVVSGAATGEDWVCIFNTTTMLGSYVQTPIGWDYQKIFIPVKKNDYVQLDYGNVTIRNFRFIYAVGSESEAN